MPFPVKDTPISLLLYNVGRWDFDGSDLGSALFNAYTSVENIIEVAGDGEVPASALPFEVVKEGAYVLIANDDVGAEGWKLRWGDVKDVLWGLREYLIGGRHLGNMVGAMVYREPGHRLAGYARVLGQKIAR